MRSGFDPPTQVSYKLALSITLHCVYGHTVYTHHTHPVQGPGTMGVHLDAWKCTGQYDAQCTQCLHLRIAPRVLHFIAIHSIGDSRSSAVSRGCSGRGRGRAKSGVQGRQVFYEY